MRAASSWAATFLVPADAAQAVVDPTGLEVAHIMPGKAAVTIPFVNYIDSDLDSYHEAGISFLVRPHDAKERRAPGRGLEVMRGKLAVYIHYLPVDKEFTLFAGRQIWGYPKFKADIHFRDEGFHEVCEVSEDGERLFTLEVKNGSMFHLPNRTPPTYTFFEGVLRRTEWEMPGVKIGARFGGAKLDLGDHPIADELRALGLPAKAFMTQTIPSMRAKFGPATVIRRA